MSGAVALLRARRENTVGRQPVRVAVDLETTGLNPEQDAIIEIGALKFAGDEIVDTFESFVAPGAPLPYRVQRLTGIAPSQLKGAPTMAELSPRLRAFLGEAPLVGHSVQFDAAFLRRWGLARRNPLVDTYELASTLLPNLSSYTLGSVGVALGVASPTFHRALADAQLARDVFLALLRRLDALDATTREALGHLAVPRDWTPAYFIRQAGRDRESPMSRGFGGGTLGQQLAAKLGVDPAALALAIAPDAGQAKPRRHAAAVAPLPLPAISPAVAQTAARAGETLRAALRGAVGAAFDDAGILLAEVQNDGGGGAACLAEALRWARERGERALVSVADGEAASRLTQYEVPRAAELLGIQPGDVRVAELIEREHYLCLHRWFGVARESRDGLLPLDVARGLAKLTVWAGETYTGARNEVALGGQEAEAWERARSGPEFADSSPTCAYRRDGYCFVARAQSAAEEAQVVVTTHAALAKQLAGSDALLPSFARTLVLDAHLLEEELRRARSCTLDRRELLAQLAALAEAEPGGRRAGLFHLAAERLGNGEAQRAGAWFNHVGRARQAAEHFFAAVRGLLGDDAAGGEPQARGGDNPEQSALRLDEAVKERQSWPSVVAAWTALRERLAAVDRCAHEVAQLVLAARGVKSPSADGVATDLLAMARALEQAQRDGDAILLHDHHNDDTVTWLRVPYPSAAEQHQQPDRRGRDGGPRRGNGGGARGPRSQEGLQAGQEMEAPVLHRAPTRVGRALEPLYSSGGLVVTAPALAIGGDLTFSRVSLGLPEAARTLSPDFDRTEQTLLCLPTDVPEPNAPQYQRRLDESIIQLATALQGRLVVILPSHAALRSAAVGIRRALEQRDILLLAQGQDGSARQLWHTFRTEPRVVLLGAGAFWEGAEQAEQPPACVVVTRVPFPPLTDPLLAARSEAWPDPQAQFVVPHAALRMRQALGGLAWSHWRRNAVVLFDRRLQTRGYGPTILGTLAKCTQFEDTVGQIVERVTEWVG